MIKSVELQNFQGHINSTLHFHKGVNVIKGTSCHGKSSIIRALRWVILHRPIGFGFKNYFCDKKEYTRVIVTLDNGVIIRERNMYDNRYVIDRLILEAMRGEVPDEVKKVLCMNDINIQSQHSGYFLLQIPPGEVAKKLNSVANLDIIDVVRDEVKSDIFKAKTNLQANKKKVKEISELLPSYDNIPKYEKAVKELEIKVEEKETSEKKLKFIDGGIASIKKCQETIDKHSKVISKEKKVNSLLSLLNTNKENSLKLSSLLSCIKNIQNMQEIIKDDSEWLTIEKPFIEILKLFDKRNKVIETSNVIISIVKEIKSASNTVKKWNEKVSIKEKEWEQFKKEIGICPLCGTKLK
jgi:exonuclease VII small subunit